jgi:hypothetical protein
MFHTNWLNLNEYTTIEHDFKQNDYNLFVDKCSLLESPKTTLNFSTNASKLFKNGG